MRRIAMAVVSAALTASWASAAIVANFGGGAGTALPDQFTGAAGDGWVGPWVSAATNATTGITAAVTNSSPLNGNGNYLSFTETVLGTGSGQARAGVYRRYGDSGDVSLAGNVHYRFLFRVDSSSGFTDQYNDQIIFLDSGIGQTFNPGDSATRWQVVFRAGGQIRYYSGTNTTTAAATWTTGTLYEFLIDSYASTKTYDLTIRNASTSTDVVTATGQSWRGAATLGNSQGGYLHIVPGIKVASTDIGNHITWSADSFAITAVPEPSIIALAGLSMLALARRRRA